MYRWPRQMRPYARKGANYSSELVIELVGEPGRPAYRRTSRSMLVESTDLIVAEQDAEISNFLLRPFFIKFSASS